MSSSKPGAMARASALQAAYEALERMLAIGLTDLQPAQLDAVQHRIMQDGCGVEFAVLMGGTARLVCSLVTPDLAERVEIFRVELGELDPREIQ